MVTENTDSTVLLNTDLPLPSFIRGKIRDAYDLGNHLLIIASDRISAYDVVLPGGMPSLRRKAAYEMVQRNAMRAWKGNKEFSRLLKADPEVTAILSPKELESLFDLQYYLRNVDEIFERVGLTATQWQAH